LFTDKNKKADLRLRLGLRFLRRLDFPKKLGLLGGMYGETLARQGVVWVKTSAGPVWKLDLRNSTHRWIVFGDYEGPGFVGWAKHWVREDSVVVDSGANIGKCSFTWRPKSKQEVIWRSNPFLLPGRGWRSACRGTQDGR